LEKIIEANILLSGLGFESGGLAAAHSIHDGLTALEETHRYYHGEKVAFGTITQLILQDSESEMLDEVIDFCMSVGLPTTLAHLGLADSDRKKLMPVGEKACAKGSFMVNMPMPVTPDAVVDAMLTADAMGKAAVI
jgi:glycerol dehydrogenase